jgi:hypothetical protein
VKLNPSGTDSNKISDEKHKKKNLNYERSLVIFAGGSGDYERNLNLTYGKKDPDPTLSLEHFSSSFIKWWKKQLFKAV